MYGIFEIQEKLINEFLEKKEKLIKERLGHLGIDVDVYVDSISQRKCRFNPILLEKHEGFGELIYYNDGTKNGLFVIGFKETAFESSYKIGMSQEYFTEEPEWAKIK